MEELFRVHEHLADRRTGAGLQARQFAVKILPRADLERRQAEGQGQLGEIRARNAGGPVGAGIATLQHGFLRVLDHEVAVVVEDDDLDRQLVMHDRLQFLEIHHHAAVAIQTEDRNPSRPNPGK